MKITQEQQKEGQEFYQKLISRAWGDNNFKEELITNPIQAIEKFTGNPLNLTKDRSIVVEDQSDASKVFLNIPRKLDVADFELTDEQLEKVAGGGSPFYDIGVAVGIFNGLLLKDLYDDIFN